MSFLLVVTKEVRWSTGHVMGKTRYSNRPGSKSKQTQQISHRPIKCHSCLWFQIGTKVNGSRHGTKPLLKPTGIQIATKPLPGPIDREHRKLIGLLKDDFFGCELQFLLSGVLAAFQNLNHKLQGRLTDVLSIQASKSSNMVQNVF